MSGDPFDRFLDEPAYTPADIDRILEERNNGPRVNPALPAGVPHIVMDRLLEDMAARVAAMRSWSCATFREYDLHGLCHHHTRGRVA